MERRTGPLVHIGYHKTGTTWLQSGLFVDREAGFYRPWTSKQLRDSLVLPSSLEFDADEARRVLAPGVESIEGEGLVPVASDERLSGSPHAGGLDSAEIAERLAGVFPEARVLIVIREQRAAILSTFKQYIRDGGAAPLGKYLSPRRPEEVPQFRFEHWEYHRLIERYQSLFGADRVLVLPFENLVQRPEAFALRIQEFIGQTERTAPSGGREYPALSALTLAIKRQANRLLVRTALNPSAPLYVKDHERKFERLDRLLPRWWSGAIERRWRREVVRRTESRYATSNRRTAELTGLDLAGLGYRVEPAGAGEPRAPKIARVTQ